jgi:hypothetical protein
MGGMGMGMGGPMKFMSPFYSGFKKNTKKSKFFDFRIR